MARPSHPQVKKALSSPEGAFRATFEDKILMSDIVFVKTWFTVEIPKFYAPVTNLLLAPEDKGRWKGMKTVGEIKRERGLRADVNPDHLYREVERQPRVFNELQVPRNLQRDLPYSLKPKFAAKGRSLTSERVAVELDSKEREVRGLMRVLGGLAEDKEQRLEEAKRRRVGELVKRQEAAEAKKFKRQKEARKQVARAVSKEQIRKEKQAAKGGGRAKRD